MDLKAFEFSFRLTPPFFFGARLLVVELPDAGVKEGT